MGLTKLNRDLVNYNKELKGIYYLKRWRDGKYERLIDLYDELRWSNKHLIRDPKGEESGTEETFEDAMVELPVKLLKDTST